MKFRLALSIVATTLAPLGCTHASREPASEVAENLDENPWPFEGDSLYIYRPGDTPYRPYDDPVSTLVFFGQGSDGSVSLKGEKPPFKRRGALGPVTPAERSFLDEYLREELDKIDGAAIARMRGRRRSPMKDPEADHHLALGRDIPMSRLVYLTFLSHDGIMPLYDQHEVLRAYRLARGEIPKAELTPADRDHLSSFRLMRRPRATIVGGKLRLPREEYTPTTDEVRKAIGWQERLRPNAGKAPDRVPVTTLKMVRGQELASGVAAKLPWQVDYEHLAPGPERFRFEFSRASSLREGAYLKFTFAYMVAQAAHETLLMGGRLEDAAIYAHFTTPEVTEYMLAHFPLRPFETPEPGHAIVRATVAEILDHEGFGFLAMFHDLRAKSESLGGLSAAKTIELLFALEAMHERLYDVIEPAADGAPERVRGQMLLSDNSALTRLRFAAACRRAEIDPEVVLRAFPRGRGGGYGINEYSSFNGKALEEGRELVEFELLPDLEDPDPIRLEEIDLRGIRQDYLGSLRALGAKAPEKIWNRVELMRRSPYGPATPKRLRIPGEKAAGRYRAVLRPTRPTRYLTSPW